MLSPDEFRRIALKMDGAVESAHMGHPDFRVSGRIFATLLPDGERGMVKLTPEQQKQCVGKDATTFVPGPGAWGRQGCTCVRLDSADAATVREAMKLAWQNIAEKRALVRPRSVRSGRTPRLPRKR